MIQFIPLLIGLPLIGFWFWMLIDLSNNDYLPQNTKNNWFLAFILLNIFAALWYYMVEYRPRNM
jgi:hypothetical protein